LGCLVRVIQLAQNFVCLSARPEPGVLAQNYSAIRRFECSRNLSECLFAVVPNDDALLFEKIGETLLEIGG
jgi:hypothetical protein